MAEETGQKGEINLEFSQGTTGLNMDSIPSQIGKGSLSYALNAALENFDSNSVTYQNEPGNEFCINFPHNYILIGKYLITEQSRQLYFLANPSTGDSEIGQMINNDCIYRKIVNAKCLNFDIKYPIHKVVHKTSNCGTEVYWAQPNEDRRYINIDNIPYLPITGSSPCDESYTNELDCNQLRVQPSFSIPQMSVKDVIIGGNLIAGTYQFAFQYSDALGSPLTNYYSITNPTPIADPQFATVNFNYPVGKSIIVDISNIEIGGQFEYFNLAVIKTINAITSVELVGTFTIEGTDREISYSGQNVDQIRLTINDVFEKFPFYGPADDVTTAQDVLIWKGLSSPERVNYQNIANKISVLWETYRIPTTENYADELNATNLRGYLRDEVYPLEIVFLLTSGRMTDGFHIPGKALSSAEAMLPMIDPSNNDFIEDPANGPVEYWKIYNTAQVIGFSPEYPGTSDISYKGPYQFGTFSYWQSTDTYPCDEEMWGELASKPIRHHKFPDVEVSPIIECPPFSAGDTPVMGNVAIFPIGIKISNDQIQTLINQSELTAEQKADIVGYKIVRGDRTDNKSIVAKGILRNVNKYKREDQDFYYANYPYNDLTEDPFLNSVNNAYSQQCESFAIQVDLLNIPATPEKAAHASIKYVDCNTNKEAFEYYYTTGVKENICSIGKPIVLGSHSVYNQTAVRVSYLSYDVWTLASGGTVVQNCGDFNVAYEDYLAGPVVMHIPGHNWGGADPRTIFVVPGTTPYCVDQVGDNCEKTCGKEIFPRPELNVRNYTCSAETPQAPVSPDWSHRQIFNSPETSFGQPFLGDVLKLESVMFGGGLAHFVEVKDNAKYRLITKEAQQDALTSSGQVGGDDAAAVFTAYQAYLEIYINGITRKNYAYSFNSIADYNYCVSVPDDLGIKQRRLDLRKYLIPAVQSVGEQDVDINNYQRETSVYLKTVEESDSYTYTAIPFPHLSPNMVPLGIRDRSRFTVGCKGPTFCPVPGTSTTTTTIPPDPFCPASCSTPEAKHAIKVVSYYASLKNTFRNQWGQIYTYKTIDTGFQVNLKSTEEKPTTVFGGDTFITRFAFKTKLPFFIDNRVGAPDDSEIFYDELGNIAYPKYWHSARSVLEDFSVYNLGTMTNIISYKAHNFDCPNCQYPGPPSVNPFRTYYDGMFYLFAYGIPNFYCETSYNLDLRQAFNNREGDFWPHVTNGIPDDWVQESFVSIANDNTYYYNSTFSKQNKETFFSHIPPNFEFKQCEFVYPFRAIFSDPQIATADTTVNNWLTYRASSYFDFPQNHGNLTSLDGIENGQVLARFENKSLLYNALYTNQTNTGGQVYLGQSLFSRQPPPFDYGETDLGYIGSQHKMLLKIPQGQISIDAKRGQIFLMSGHQAKDLSASGSGMNRFLTDHLAFEILRFFPAVNIDNNFDGIGLHGVYDSKYDRIIITKLDYIPLSDDIKYDVVTQEFYIEETFAQVPVSLTTSTSTTIGPGSTTSTTTLVPLVIRTKIYLSDSDYFCNKSWTLSFSFITNSWVSFHSYIPNWYIAENNFFYSGKKSCCTDFDFTFLTGTLFPDPITTTTTTIFPPPPTTSSTTTVFVDCTLSGGTVDIKECTLIGTGIITIPPPPPCLKPINLIPFSLGEGYDVIAPPSSVISTGSLVDACNAKTLVFSDFSNVIISSITGYGTGLTVGSTVYANDISGSCVYIADGFYFTPDPEGIIYEIVGGIIVALHPCSVPTTTTTSTTLCEIHLYTIELYSCDTCTLIGGGTIGNSELLTIGDYYYDVVTEFKLKIISYNGCAPGSDRTILDSSGSSICPSISCL